jgi:2-polyprenyl-3-methyl-5-hydroxy-6-metoxy-1,4-benzoquinol methylase
MDRSNGYENIAAQFLAARGNARSTAGIGVTSVRKWARTLPPGAAVIDLGCGPGIPITQVLVTEGLNVCAVEYKRQLHSVGLSLLNEHEDEGQNHYYEFIKAGINP